MAAIARSKVSIRLFGDDLDPAEITAILGRTPTKQYRKGPHRVSAERTYQRKYGAWIVAAEDCEPEAIDTQLSSLLFSMTQDLAVWRELGTRYDVDVFCGAFMDETNEGFSLMPATLQALADRGLEIGFDVYAPTEEDTPIVKVGSET